MLARRSCRLVYGSIHPTTIQSRNEPRLRPESVPRGAIGECGRRPRVRAVELPTELRTPIRPPSPHERYGLHTSRSWPVDAAEGAPFPPLHGEGGRTPQAAGRGGVNPVVQNGRCCCLVTHSRRCSPPHPSRSSPAAQSDPPSPSRDHRARPSSGCSFSAHASGGRNPPRERRGVPVLSASSCSRRHPALGVLPLCASSCGSTAGSILCGGREGSLRRRRRKMDPAVEPQDDERRSCRRMTSGGAVAGRRAEGLSQDDERRGCRRMTSGQAVADDERRSFRAGCDEPRASPDGPIAIGCGFSSRV
jgi:hypothetical protein